MKTAVKHLNENSFFTAGNITLKQDKGILLGTDPTPYLANLFLHFNENQFMAEVISNNEI